MHVQTDQYVALLLVDYQPIYTNNPHVIDQFPRLAPNVSALLRQSRSDLPPENIIHIRTNYNLTFAKNFKRLHPEKPIPPDVDSVEWARAKENEKIIVKSTFGAFQNTELNEYLQKIQARKIIVCGLLTSVCVLFSSQSAFAMGYEVYLFEPGCADRDKGRHDSIIKIYDGYIFENVTSVQ